MNSIILAIIIGAMIAVDMGGSINEIAIHLVGHVLLQKFIQ